MLYLLAIVLPPVAVLLVGKPFQAFINLVLCLFFYVPGIIHALFVVNEKKADRRMKKQAELIAKANRNN
ncbi:YqaE/Pmp3 family membrane protein [Bacillus sp. ISL-18]|uniref:YqaE/Pmp3 family membrane protein n=1 Tax=Bacillus sp. ISL-18 TaxID=2819118 RepID=UPI001BEC597E|nr:YqaE/Pmp3 family membrane protein [Bacillus sp. ISL-18]MBT2656629.1 YqaE/Pmp3 family membrane protein [Bacillus sp. ISL-18]